MDTNPIKSHNIFDWLYTVCLSVKTQDQVGTTSKLIQIARDNKRIDSHQYYDLFIVLYEKILCGKA